ncbi:MAG: YncE family protein [Blastocatellia bacterium]|nr:YncE family protein [Blastocatellia bacterium]
MIRFFLFHFVFFSLGVGAFLQAQTPELVTTVKTGAGGIAPTFVAVNSLTRRMYVANVLSYNVSVVDLSTKTVTKTVGCDATPQGIAVQPKTNRIYALLGSASNTRNSSVAVIDGTTDQILANVPLPGYGGRLSINAETNRLYVTDNGFFDVVGTSVWVLDLGSNAVVNTIPVGKNPTDVAVNTLTNRVYVTCSGTGKKSDSQVVVVDGTNDKPLATVKVGQLPSRVVVSETDNRVYVADNGSPNKIDQEVTVVDGNTNKVVKQISLPLGFDAYTGPMELAVTGDGAQVFVSSVSYSTKFEASRNVFSISGKAAAVETKIKLTEEPGQFVTDPLTGQLYTAFPTKNRVAALDRSQNTLTALVVVGNPPQFIGVNPVTNTIYVGSGSESLLVLNGATNTLEKTVQLGFQAGGIAVSPNKNRIYLSNPATGSIVVLDGRTLTDIATIKTGAPVTELALNPETNRLYGSANGNATDASSLAIVICDTAANTLVTKIPIEKTPSGIGINLKTNRIYVAGTGNKFDENLVYVIDGAVDAVTATIKLPNSKNSRSGEIQDQQGAFVVPGGFKITVNPVTERIYATRNIYIDNASVAILDGARNIFFGQVKTDTPSDLFVNPATNRLFVANGYSQAISVIDCVTNETSDRLQLDSAPQGMVFNPVTGKLYVIHQYNDSLSVVKTGETRN